MQNAYLLISISKCYLFKKIKLKQDLVEYSIDRTRICHRVEGTNHTTECCVLGKIRVNVKIKKNDWEPYRKHAGCASFNLHC